MLFVSDMVSEPAFVVDMASGIFFILLIQISLKILSRFLNFKSKFTC